MMLGCDNFLSTSTSNSMDFLYDLDCKFFILITFMATGYCVFSFIPLNTVELRLLLMISESGYE